MKTALITGANKSIGFEIARNLSKEGFFVYMGSRNLEAGKKAVDTLASEGFENLEAIQIDITDVQSIDAAKAAIASRHGSLDVLVNNAGISGDFPQQPSTTTTDVVRKVFDTNFFGTIDVTTRFIDLLRQSQAPRIVNVTSGLGSLTLHSDPTWKYYAVKNAAYGPSKTALNAYTVALAHELKDTAFKVNTIDPGYTATDFNHHSGPGSVEDAGRFVAQYALLGDDGPNGRFFSLDHPENNNESPW